MLTALLLMTSAVAPAELDKTLEHLVEPADTFEAWKVRPIPEEIKKHVEIMPDDGRWVRTDDRQPRPLAGVFLLAPLDQHIRDRLRLLNWYPGGCQVKIGAALSVSDAQKEAIKKVAAADCRVALVDDQVAMTSEGVPRWTAVLIGLGGLGLGALAAILATRQK